MRNIVLASLIGLIGFLMIAEAQAAPPSPTIHQSAVGCPRQAKRCIEIIGPTVSAANPVAEKTVKGPNGPITIKSTFLPGIVDSPAAEAALLARTATSSSPTNNAVNSAYYVGSGTCKSQYWQPSYRFTIYTPWQWNYRSVTWMGTTRSDAWALPLFHWENQKTWNDWAPGWRYAWGNGSAELRYGAGPLSFTYANARNNALVDAWGNCTPHQWFWYF